MSGAESPSGAVTLPNSGRARIPFKKGGIGMFFKLLLAALIATFTKTSW